MIIIWLILICLALIFFGGNIFSLVIVIIPVAFAYYILDKLGTSEDVKNIILIIISILDLIFILFKGGLIKMTDVKK